MKTAANLEVLHHRGNYLVRRQRLGRERRARGIAIPFMG